MKFEAEKKRRFHESLLQLLYPSPPPKEENHEFVYATQDDLKLERGLPYSSCTDEDEDEGEGKGEGDGEDECDVPKNLTRAQRKRLRKKKLKEAASTRRKLIGPILPSCEDDVAVGVSQNPDIGTKDHESELTTSCSKRNKQKHRRMTKKLASERLKISSTVDRGGGALSENEQEGS